MSSKTISLHYCYHKCLTLYFNDVFKEFARQAGLVFQNTAFALANPAAADIILSHDSSLDLAGMPRPWRATHIIRDPRDLLVSAYFYHLRTEEAWCARPNSANTDLPGDVSYQQHLRSLDLEQGLIWEMRHVAGRVTELMGEWDYSQPGFLEIRYEDVLDNEESWFRRIFRWYGFKGSLVTLAAHIAERYSAKRLQPADPGYGHRNRKSRPGYWKGYFSDNVKREYRRLYRDIPVKLGYEPHPEW